MVPDGSRIDIPVPYLAVDLRWVDASSDDRSQHAADPSHHDVNGGFDIRTPGAVSIFREKQWNPHAATPSEPSIFIGKKFIGVFLRTLEFGDALPDSSPCERKYAVPRGIRRF